MNALKSVLAALAFGLATTASAQETIDVGVLKNQDIQVVQKLLYPKAGRLEVGGQLGWMPFDAYTTTPMGSLFAVKHFTETLGAELSLSGGYGLKNGAMRTLEGPAYGITPDAYRFLSSALLDAQWSPIYAKMNWQGKRIVHHDVYALGGLGVTIEQAIMPDKSVAVAPTLGLGLGTRLFWGKGALHVQIRDDLLYQTRTKTQDTHGQFLKQNVAVTVGYGLFLGGK